MVSKQRRLLLCSDLDRTVIPNGAQQESSDARPRFSRFCHRPEVTVVYVTGRHRGLVEQAIKEYNLPVPDYAITDVGTKIYHIRDGVWHELDEWLADIDQDWQGRSAQQISELFADINELTLQESSKQNLHKLSYYVPLQIDEKPLLLQMEQRLQAKNILASLIWSIDEPNEVGLLDILPKNATKLHAVEFLYHVLDFALDEVVFAGDSGNDLPVMGSEVPSVLVANASQEIKHLAQQLAAQQGNSNALYIASGNHLAMNGNYSAGILEGVWHYSEAFRTVLQEV